MGSYTKKRKAKATTKASRTYAKIASKLDRALAQTKRSGETKFFTNTRAIVEDTAAANAGLLNLTVFEGMQVTSAAAGRLSSKIFFKSLRVEYTCDNNNATNNALPSKYEFYLIRTNQFDTNYVTNQWFQNPTSELGVPWNSFANGSDRIVTRKNVSPETYEIIAYKCFDLYGATNSISQKAKSGVFFFKLPNGGEEITFRDISTAATVAPINQIFPRYQLYAYSSRHDALPHFGPAVAMTIAVRTIAYYHDS